MVARLRKTRKLRGHVSFGHGRVGRHRKHQAGRGMAGGLTHHRTLMDRFHPGYFGKKGMRFFHLKRNKLFKPSINIDKLVLIILFSGASSARQPGPNTPTTRTKCQLLTSRRPASSRYWARADSPTSQSSSEPSSSARPPSEESKPSEEHAFSWPDPYLN